MTTLRQRRILKERSMRMRDIKEKIDSYEDRVDLWLDRLAAYDRTARLLLAGVIILFGMILIAVLK